MVNKILFRDGRFRIELVDGEELEHALWHLRQAGIQCVIELQRTIGIYDTWETAAQNWDRMNWYRRAQTFQAHELLYSEGDHIILDPRIRRYHV